jgi:hypothetical protein
MQDGFRGPGQIGDDVVPGARHFLFGQQVFGVDFVWHGALLLKKLYWEPNG